jgi:glyceraldehyde 3-phosphate dehydrogenase
MITIAINGYGRIGRNVVRAIYENGYNQFVKIAAINDLGDIAINAHLTKYDSTHGHFKADVHVENEYLVINGDRILVTSEKNPANLPWKTLNIDVVYECTGFFTKRDAAQAHLTAGAKKVLISAPGQDVDATIVYGVNHHILTASDTIVSNASCTTNCLAPLVKPLHEKLGIVSGLMNTVHAYTNDQSLLDTYHPDLRRARAAAESIIPSKTGAAAAVGLVIPELNGKLDGFALRVPTPNVSVVDLTFKATRETSVQEVNAILTDAANNELKNVLVVNHEPLVSRDFNHNPASSIFDATQTKVIGDLVKVLSWYDNEWGFSNRMIDTSLVMMKS